MNKEEKREYDKLCEDFTYHYRESIKLETEIDEYRSEMDRLEKRAIKHDMLLEKALNKKQAFVAKMRRKNA